MLPHLIVVKDYLKGGVVLKNKKTLAVLLLCLSFAQILVHLPPPDPDCERVTNEFAGNFLITNNNIPSAKDESQSMILWQSDGMLPISALSRFTIVLAAQKQLPLKSLEQ